MISEREELAASHLTPPKIKPSLWYDLAHSAQAWHPVIPLQCAECRLCSQTMTPVQLLLPRAPQAPSSPLALSPCHVQASVTATTNKLCYASDTPLRGDSHREGLEPPALTALLDPQGLSHSC